MREAKGKEDISFVPQLGWSPQAASLLSGGGECNTCRAAGRRHFRSLADVLDFVSVCADLAPPPARLQ